MGEELKALTTIKKLVKDISADHGFTVLDFGVNPADEDQMNARLRIVVEYDPEKEKKPDIIMVQVDQAMTEEAEAVYKAQLEKDVEEARKQLTEDTDLEKKLRGKGGFLDD